MLTSRGYAAKDAKSKLAPFSFERRHPRANDVVIEIAYCGVCHSDIHAVRNEWGNSLYPIVPGHEIVGVVKQVGASVKKFKVGDRAGVGCMVDSCGDCPTCLDGLEQFCQKGAVFTYCSYEKDGKTLTYGGYSNNIVVREEFVLKIPANLDFAATAPLLCAGITTYSPLNHWKVSKGQKVGIVGLGGLGHMGVKIARALGANVTVFTTSDSKKEDAKRLGAHEVVLSRSESEMKACTGTFDFILDTVSAPHDINAYLQCLKHDSTMVTVGVPDKPSPIAAMSLIFGRKSLAGSLIGGVEETQQMLDFCGKHGIVSDIEMIKIQDVNEAYERVIKGDVKYRFVIDLKSLG